MDLGNITSQGVRRINVGESNMSNMSDLSCFLTPINDLLTDVMQSHPPKQPSGQQQAVALPPGVKRPPMEAALAPNINRQDSRLNIAIVSLPTGGLGDLVFGIKLADFISTYYESSRLVSSGTNINPVHIYYFTSWDGMPAAIPQDVAGWLNSSPTKFVVESITPEKIDSYILPLPSGYVDPGSGQQLNGVVVQGTAGAKITFVFLESRSTGARYPLAAPRLDLDILFVAPKTHWPIVDLKVNNLERLAHNSYLMSEYNPESYGPQDMSIVTGVGGTNLPTAGYQHTVGLMVENKATMDMNTPGIPPEVAERMTAVSGVPILGNDNFVPLYSICYIYMSPMSDVSVQQKIDLGINPSMAAYYLILRCFAEYLRQIHEFVNENYPYPHIMVSDGQGGRQPVIAPIYILVRSSMVHATGSNDIYPINDLLDLFQQTEPQAYEAGNLALVHALVNGTLQGFAMVETPTIRHEDMIRIYQHSLPLVFISGDQSITDYLSVRKDFTTRIFYHAFAWKTDLARKLGIDLARQPVCGVVDVQNLNVLARDAENYFKFLGMLIVNALLVKAYLQAANQYHCMYAQDVAGKLNEFVQSYQTLINNMIENEQGVNTIPAEAFDDPQHINFGTKNVQRNLFGPIFYLPSEFPRRETQTYVTSFLHKFAKKRAASIFVKFLEIQPGECVPNVDRFSVKCATKLLAGRKSVQNRIFTGPDYQAVNPNGEDVFRVSSDGTQMEYAVVGWTIPGIPVAWAPVNVLPDGVNALLVNQLINKTIQHVSSLIKTYASFVDTTDSVRSVLPRNLPAGALGAFLFQEFISGSRNFREYVQGRADRQGVLRPPPGLVMTDFWQIMFQTLSILSFLQCNLHMVHNDLWARNILLEELNTPRAFTCLITRQPDYTEGFFVRFYSRWRVRIIDFDDASYTVMGNRYCSESAMLREKSPAFLPMFDITFLFCDLLGALEEARTFYHLSSTQESILGVTRQMLDILVPGWNTDRRWIEQRGGLPFGPLPFAANDPQNYNNVVGALHEMLEVKGQRWGFAHTPIYPNVASPGSCTTMISDDVNPPEQAQLADGTRIDLPMPDFRVQ